MGLVVVTWFYSMCLVVVILCWSMGLVVVNWCYPCSPCSYFSRTYCDLWHRWVYLSTMEWTMPNESRTCRICRRVFNLPVSISRGRTRTYCDFWYLYNGMDNAEWKSDIQDMHETVQKKKSVPDQFTVVKYRSETYSWTKSKQGRLRGRQLFEIRRMRLRFVSSWLGSVTYLSPSP
jgi:hypothetical protein